MPTYAVPQRILVALCLILAAVPVQAQNWTSEDCAECHTDSGGDPVEVTLAHLTGSVHEDFECLDCHTDVVDLPHDELGPADCAACHEDVVENYTMHGKGVVGKSRFVPTCADCHGSHGIRSALDRESSTNPLNLPLTCGTCHEDSTLTDTMDIRFKHPIRVYQESVHGRATAGEDFSAASCNDCHGVDGSAHAILPPNVPESTISHFRIHETCGECHGAIAEDYLAGVHGQLLVEGRVDTPTCTDCHGEHGILHTDDPRSPVSPYRLAEATCTPCHDSAALNNKYQLPTDQVRSHVDSYHGLKSQEGDKSVANCASCHGAHLILPPQDERSSVNPANLENTCGRCHQGITADVARRPIHDQSSDTEGIAGVVRLIYLGLIFSVIGGMAFHWLIDLIRQVRAVMRKTPQVRRMEPGEVFQHTILALSFTVLVVTGFSLRFHDTWWSELLFGRDGGFHIRGYIHRGAGLLMIAGSVWHLFYIVLTERGREFLRDMVPTIEDGRQAFQKMGFNLGLTREAPRFKRFCYVEKAEYWALIWGTVVMVVTGFGLWYENIVAQWVSRDVMNVLLTIHYYEAWLAFLAILVWHMYAVVFNPEVYPGNPAWITGKMPQDMFEHEHPAVELVEHRHVVRTRVAASEVTMAGREKVDTRERRDGPT